ncbi:unnamed protein product [Camellia sinensis]
MVLNVLLTFSWLQTAFHFQVFYLHKRTLTQTNPNCTCSLPRDFSTWLENEHLNNVGKYRAFKTVPLPFNYDEEEGKNE